MPFARSDVAPRLEFSLDGLWDFAYSGPAAQLAGTRQIRVPGIWQAQFAELRNTTGTGRYSRMVEVPEAWAGRRVFLVLEGVFHHAEIFVDGARVGAHRNAWTPVELDLSAALGGRRTFALEVVATVPDDRDYARGGSFTTALAGKQDWYGFQGGIWKSVRLEARDAAHLSGVSVQTLTDLSAHRVRVRADATGAAASVLLTLDQGRRRHRRAAPSGRAGGDRRRHGGAGGGAVVAGRARTLRPRGDAARCRRRGAGYGLARRRLPLLREPRRQALPQRRALLHVRRPRPGLVPGGGVPVARPRLPRAAFPQRQGHGPQHAALSRQDSGQALSRTRRPARPHRLARHALHGVPGARNARAAGRDLP